MYTEIVSPDNQKSMEQADSSSSNPVYNSLSIIEDTNQLVSTMDEGLLRAAISSNTDDEMKNLISNGNTEIVSPDNQKSMEQADSSSSNPVYNSLSIIEDTNQLVSTMDKGLLRAAISGNTDEMKNLISNGNTEILLGTTSQGSTCLHISLSFGHQQFSEALCALEDTLVSGLLSSLNSDQETPLIVAVKSKSGHVSLASTLLKQYERLKLSEMILKQDINHDSAVHHAIRHGHKDLALELIKANSNFSQSVNKYNESPMYIAVMRGLDDVFRSLWETDHPSHKGPYDDNALHAAVRNQNLGIIQTIMQKCPNLAKEENKSGHTPIQYAVHRNQPAVIEVMLEHDGSLGYLVNNMQEKNPLLIAAASRGYVDVAREILTHCPDAPYRNEAGLTILHKAVIEAQEEFVEFIMRNRQFDKLINMRDCKEYTALHYAVERCNPIIVRSLLAHKEIDVRIYDSNGKPAFWRLIDAMDSAKSLDWNEVFMLMSKADPQAKNFYLRHVAAKNIREKSMKKVKSLTKTYTTTTSLVAILIATITFAAAFAMPGGYSIHYKTEGLPVMERKPSLKAFLISDTLAMCSSLAVAFICILARWADLRFLLYYRSVTKMLMWFALMATNVAFATGLYTVLHPHFLWLAILICGLSISIPFLTYVLGKWPILKLRFRLRSSFDSTLLDMV